MIETLDEKGMVYYTYSLPQDKLLKVIIKGMPEKETAERVSQDLKEQGFNPIRISQLISTRTGQNVVDNMTTRTSDKMRHAI